MYNHLLNIPAKRHQVFAVNYALKHHWSINAYPQGHGKTLVAMVLSLHTKLPTLVICPAFLKYNWEKEFKKFSKKNLKVRILFSKDLQNFVISDEDVIILNYEIAHNAENIFKWAKLVVLDESHKIGSPSSRMTKHIFKYCIKYKPERLLLMSGSPIRGRVAHWYVPIKLTGSNPLKTSGEYWEKKYIAFQDMFSKSRMVHIGTRMFKKYYGIQNEDKLRSLLVDKYLRKCPDFELELPKIRFQDVIVDYDVEDQELWELYQEYEKNKKMSDSLASAKKANALSKVPFTYKYAKNIIESGEGPFVIYSDHPQVVLDLSIMFSKVGISNSVIIGGTKMEDRQKFIEDFQKGNIEIFLATIGAASTGITITRANLFAFNDKSWVTTENEQAYKRIHRISQTRDCVVYSILSGKVDKMIIKNNEEKDDVISETTDHRSFR